MSLQLLSLFALGFTFVWLLGWAAWALRRLLERDQNTLLFGFLLLFVIYGAPAGLDFALGVPGYKALPGYYWASHDPLTVTLSCIYMCAVPVMWFALCRKRQELPSGKGNGVQKLRTGSRMVLHLVVISPLIGLLLAPNPLLYTSYGVTIRYVLSPAELEHHLYLRILGIFSLLAGARLLSQQRRLFSFQSIHLGLAAFAVIWIHGKRNIVAFAAFLVGYQLWHRGWLRRRHLLPALIIGVVSLTVYSQIYNRVVREVQVSNYASSQFLEDARLDFCRDHVLRLVIRAELRDQRILEYRGQSLLLYVPRKLWSDKPMPYGVYVLAAAFGAAPGEAKHWGWFHPTGVLDEAIANCGWLGMLLGPLIVGVIGLLGNRARGVQVRGLTALTIVLVLHLPLQNVVPVVAVWAWLLWFDLRNRKRERRSLPRSPTPDTRS